MARFNVLVEGVSGAGKTSVCRELSRRGFLAINGDTDLAYRGDPVTGRPTDVASHWHHLWRVDQVRALTSDLADPVGFFCGGSRNWADVIACFDAVLVLTVDEATLARRLEGRPGDEFGAQPEERALVMRIHASGEGLPPGIPVDATAPLPDVVDAILDLLALPRSRG